MQAILDATVLDAHIILFSGGGSEVDIDLFNYLGIDGMINNIYDEDLVRSVILGDIPTTE